ncbi:hypothetical protein B0H34DRAFT_507980 [Crassisporium funariophilum]|nr:hypothetical protein B0H34DRAFT_507980 [Crassisporium funariophilum]
MLSMAPHVEHHYHAQTPVTQTVVESTTIRFDWLRPIRPGDRFTQDFDGYYENLENEDPRRSLAYRIRGVPRLGTHFFDMTTGDAFAKIVNNSKNEIMLTFPSLGIVEKAPLSTFIQVVTSTENLHGYAWIMQTPQERHYWSKSSDFNLFTTVHHQKEQRAGAAWPFSFSAQADLGDQDYFRLHVQTSSGTVYLPSTRQLLIRICIVAEWLMRCALIDQ